MKSLYLNRDGDVEFDEMHNLKMVKDAQEVIQRNRVAISINEGEWIFNKLLGIPWIEMMKDKTKTESDYENEVLEILKNDPDINENSLEISAEYDEFNRALEISFSGKLVDGTDFKSSAGIEV
jgi:hypothetical protein